MHNYFDKTRRIHLYFTNTLDEKDGKMEKKNDKMKELEIQGFLERQVDNDWLCSFVFLFACLFLCELLFVCLSRFVLFSFFHVGDFNSDVVFRLVCLQQENDLVTS